MTTPRRDNANLSGVGEVGETKSSKPLKTITKIQRVTDLLKARAEGLNRFEAEAFGDHCLNSTIAVIRAMYGDKLIQRWETVPSRYTSKGVRCLRYWLAPGA